MAQHNIYLPTKTEVQLYRLMEEFGLSKDQMVQRLIQDYDLMCTREDILLEKLAKVATERDQAKQTVAKVQGRLFK